MATAKTAIAIDFTSGGYRNTAVGLTPDVDIRNGPCKVHSIYLGEGSGTGQCSLKVYDQVGSTEGGTALVVGTTAAHHGFPVLSSGTTIYEFPVPLDFTYGVCLAGAKENGDAAINAPDASTEVDVSTTP